MNYLKSVMLLAAIALLWAPQPLTAEEAADAFDCTACHPMKIRDFKGRRANPVTPVEASRTSPVPRPCASPATMASSWTHVTFGRMATTTVIVSVWRRRLT